jgi:pimeloyl-ACP methyl ester carboxylesterase
MTTAAAVSESTVEVAGLNIRIEEAGEGPALMLLHRSTGRHGWGALEDGLSASFRVIVPDLPGYGHSDRPDWAREPRDVAILIQQLIVAMDLSDVALVGLGFGGFVAAELATMNTDRLGSLTLIGAAGVKPDEGEIVDQMLLAYEDYIKAGLSDESTFSTHFGEDPSSDVKDVWDFSRIMTARVTWSPYMFNRRLTHLLPGVMTPALVIWGADDRVIPPSVGKQYADALANSTLETIADCGHLAELDQPERLVELISAHAKA